MANGRYGAVLEPLHRLFGRGTVASLGEGPLLERFTRGGDAAAFEAIVARHGPMVLGVCRRGLDDPHDVEDAFQATFLVLVRKAGSLRDADHLGPWLFGVARKVTARARARSALRRDRERPGGEVETVALTPAADADRHELRSVLDEEIGRLPEKFRAPIVLCYLEGLTHEEAALRLRCPVGTVRSRMASARDRLRRRLDRRGLAPAGLSVAPRALTAVPTALTESTLAAAARAAAGTLSTSATAAGAAALAKGVTTAMFLNKLTLTASALAAACLLAGGAGVLARQGGADRPAPGAPADATRDQDREDSHAASNYVTLRRQNESLQRDLRSLADEVVKLRQRLDEYEARAKRPLPGSGSAASLPPGDRVPSTSIPPQDPAALPPPTITTAPGGLPPGDAPSPQPGGGTVPAAGPGEAATVATPVPDFKAQAGASGAGIGTADRKTSRAPLTMENSGILAVVSPGGDRVLAKSKRHDVWRLYKAPKGTTVTPVLGPGVLLALKVEGPKISEVAVFSVSPIHGQADRWSTHVIDPPVEGTVTPIVDLETVMYVAGNRIYGFSARVGRNDPTGHAGRWDVLEVKGRPIPVQTPFGSGFQDDEYQSIFNIDKGRWERVDWEALEKQAVEPKDTPPVRFQ